MGNLLLLPTLWCAASQFPYQRQNLYPLQGKHESYHSTAREVPIFFKQRLKKKKKHRLSSPCNFHLYQFSLENSPVKSTHNSTLHNQPHTPPNNQSCISQPLPTPFLLFSRSYLGKISYSNELEKCWVIPGFLATRCLINLNRLTCIGHWGQGRTLAW